MRVFIAIPLTKEIKKQLAEIQSRLKSLDIRVTWGKPKIFHITLEFLGDIEEQKTLEVSAILKEACQQIKPFELKLEGLKLIPNLHNPQVIAVSVGGDLDSYWKLKTFIRNAIQPLGLGNTKENAPHITLGRIKGKLSLSDKKFFIQIVPQPLGFRIEKVTFLKSILTSTGPIYTPIAEIPLYRSHYTTLKVV